MLASPLMNDWLEVLKLGEEKQALRDKRYEERISAIAKREFKREQAMTSEEKFLRDKGHLVRHTTKYTSRYGTSNTYWVGNKQYTFDNGKQTSTYWTSN